MAHNVGLDVATFRGSSMVEQSAVNRLVVGSNPTRGVLDTEHQFYFYIVQNADGKFYVGSTDNVLRRIREHNDQSGRGATTYTRVRGPWILCWSEAHPSHSSAVRRERQVKTMKSARWIRENLLNGRVPASRD
jgi:putative endonuclease